MMVVCDLFDFDFVIVRWETCVRFFVCLLAGDKSKGIVWWTHITHVRVFYDIEINRWLDISMICDMSDYDIFGANELRVNTAR